MTGVRIEAAFAAAGSGDLEGLRAALDAEPTLVSARGAHGATLLHPAAERDDLPMIEALLERGVDPRARASWGHTPFEWAAALGAFRAAERLRAASGERLDLWSAAALGRLDVVEGCFDHDGLIEGRGREPVEGADLTGWPEDTPFRRGDHVSDAFHAACRNGHVEVARYLRSRGADVNARGYFGAPAMHWAAINGHGAVVEWLVEAGADLTIRDPRFDGTPAGWAREGGHHALAGWLEAAGG